jgi:pyridoxine 5-phosphate synthase
VAPGEITSQAGWVEGPATVPLPRVIRELKADGIRVSVFVDPERSAVKYASTLGADRVELYTEPYARAWHHSQAAGQESFARYADVAEYAHSLGLGVNAGHDLDLENLVLFRTLPHLDEVSIGHAIVSRAVFEGLGQVVRQYLDVLRVL